MPNARQILSTNSVYETIDVGATSLVAIAATTDGSNNPVYQIGRCTDLSGGGFVAVLEINCVTGVLKVNNVAVTVP